MNSAPSDFSYAYINQVPKAEIITGLEISIFIVFGKYILELVN